MFADFLKQLTAPSPTPIKDGDARLALTALLVRIARTDGAYIQTEIDRIDAITSLRYSLTPEATAKLRQDAETLESEAPDTIRFTRAIKDAVAYEDRLAVIESLWQVVLADGAREDEEDALLRLVSSLLGINDRDSALARQRVSRGL
ncbi:MAG: TerB family tellurite resistance protein [Paracoccaceae bacterium]|nr:TerB family tellurite resistance protein [Paracoccaceae bacterium]